MLRAAAPRTLGASAVVVLVVRPVVPVELLEPTWRPVRLRRVAAARAMERRDVLQRDQDVAVQFDVSDVVHGAVGRQHAVLVVAVHQGDLDLLALVLVRVVLHGAQASGLSVETWPERALGYVENGELQDVAARARRAAARADHDEGGAAVWAGASLAGRSTEIS